MFERFTDRARKVMRLATEEAKRFHSEYIGTEHILLGLIKEGSGVGANVLKNLDVDLGTVRREVEKLIQTGPDRVAPDKLPQTPRAKKVIEYAIEEARGLNHRYVGTEHLLLGLLREREGVGAQVLMNLGLKLDEVRAEVLDLLGAGVDPEAGPAPAAAGASGERAGADATGAPLFRQIDCLMFNVADLEAGLQFYRDKLGLPLVWKTDKGAGLRVGDSELVINEGRPQAPETDLTVASAEKAAQAFVAAGGTIVAGPFDIKIGKCVVVADPWGNHLVLLDMTKGRLKTDGQGNVIP